MTETKIPVENYRDFVVPTKGIEPSHPCEWQILSLLRLPIPPHGHLLGLQCYINHPTYPKYVLNIFSCNNIFLNPAILFHSNPLYYQD